MYTSKVNSPCLPVLSYMRNASEHIGRNKDYFHVHASENVPGRNESKLTVPLWIHRECRWLSRHTVAFTAISNPASYVLISHKRIHIHERPKFRKRKDRNSRLIPTTGRHFIDRTRAKLVCKVRVQSTSVVHFHWSQFFPRDHLQILHYVVSTALACSRHKKAQTQIQTRPQTQA